MVISKLSQVVRSSRGEDEGALAEFYLQSDQRDTRLKAKLMFSDRISYIKNNDCLHFVPPPRRIFSQTINKFIKFECIA